MERVIVLELNELCPPLIDQMIDAGDLPSFAAMRAASAVYTTDAGEPQDHLNPWIQWVTAHTGVGFDEHQVFKLGEGGRLRQPTLADAVGAAGGDVWLCSPMNVVPNDPVRGVWLPDPWNADDEPPDWLQPFASFVRANVQEHTNVARSLSSRDYARFLRFMAGHGLSSSTVAEVGRQLGGERVRRRPRWQRAALLDRFQWDLFEHEWKRHRPRLATYFSNTTAHYQHQYWRYFEPDAFPMQPTTEEVARYGDAIPSGYREMDRLIGRALDLAGDDTTLVLCTALSQQAYTLKDEEGGSRFHRPHDIRAFVDKLGLVGVTGVAPVMSSQFHVLFAAEDDAVVAEQALLDATVAGIPTFAVRRVGSDVFMGMEPTGDLPDDAVIHVPATGAEVRAADELYRAEVPKSGYHHPRGAFWVRAPGHVEPGLRGEVALRAVAPTILALLGVPAPATMGVADAIDGAVAP